MLCPKCNGNGGQDEEEKGTLSIRGRHTVHFLSPLLFPLVTIIGEYLNRRLQEGHRPSVPAKCGTVTE